MDADIAVELVLLKVLCVRRAQHGVAPGLVAEGDRPPHAKRPPHDSTVHAGHGDLHVRADGEERRDLEATSVHVQSTALVHSGAVAEVLQPLGADRLRLLGLGHTTQAAAAQLEHLWQRTAARRGVLRDERQGDVLDEGSKAVLQQVPEESFSVATVLSEIHHEPLVALQDRRCRELASAKQGHLPPAAELCVIAPG